MVLVWTKLWIVHERRWVTGETAGFLHILLSVLHSPFHREVTGTGGSVT